ncbi:prepilin-type N-terminal cleavage/methylation domain-containing protein [Caldibacillus lycopersici]|uniref:Prepilin-type N-terminal cleavage/methylation domain-containing protein n=1 Tax=Perspicuibacillus lycopersici TaxID=1325689 RepID=A0AAE3IT87_9BACI|nr:prepilin-type N-terminal cleavage/methylation domain-containing protein [Perspicuibacillus lycopersici]MCU9614026.1 prepilin-type N-terminal cleavage/methylation domain-containing protein [Perspicuibacillus lycopersici]
MKQKEQGFTLLEVLAAIVLLTIVSGIIWSVFFQGFHFSQTSLTKNQMQQEINYIITDLESFHRYSEQSYTINSANCKITVSNGTDSKIYEHPQLCIHSDHPGTISVNPDIEDATLTVTVTDKNDTSNTISIDTILYRLKNGE